MGCTSGCLLVAEPDCAQIRIDSNTSLVVIQVKHYFRVAGGRMAYPVEPGQLWSRMVPPGSW